MQTTYAKKFAEQYIHHHLGDEWCFKWDLKSNRFGSTQFQRKIITLSRPVTALNDKAQVLEALRHEIAHALTGEREHSDQWREVARRLGSTGNAHIDKRVVRLPYTNSLILSKRLCIINGMKGKDNKNGEK